MESKFAGPSLAALGLILARDSNLTFGGGTATSEVLRRSLGKRGWLTDEDHRRLYALSRLTPGTNLLAYCVAAGWHLRRTKGAAVCWLASSLPSSAIAVAATVVYGKAAASPSLRIVVLVGTGVSLVLLLSSAWHLARPQLTAGSWPRTLVIVLSTLALVVLGTSPVRVLIVAAVVGATWRVSAK